MSVASFIATVLLGSYFGGGFALMFYIWLIRNRAPRAALPHPLAFFGLDAWTYAFSSRHRVAADRLLSALVMFWRAAIVLLPLGIWAFLAAAQ
jgi:hypothetical protein